MEEDPKPDPTVRALEKIHSEAGYDRGVTKRIKPKDNDL